MKTVLVEKLKGYEVLSKDVFGGNGIILIPAGTVLKSEYVARLIKLGIQKVYIEEDINFNIDDATEDIINNDCKNMLSDTINRFASTVDSELSTITIIAEDVIKDIIQEKEIMYNVSLARDNSDSLYSHLLSVTALSVLIALRSGFKPSRVKEIAIGAILHDIGLLNVDKSICDKQLNEMTDKEKSIFKKHVVSEYDALENKEWATEVVKHIVLDHHERNDKSGYPLKKDGDHILREVKVVSICDQFDSMVYGYQCPKYKVKEAIDYIISKAGVEFDFDLVRVFINSVAAYPNGSRVLMSNKIEAVVIKQNYQLPTRPVLQLLIDENGNACADKKIIIDLKKELAMVIVDVLD
ncbi:MAG: HD domain-containing protein [Lachnospiraceae bacterium]|nr:HD domain-containing protein [Lachnospiraceae bacterium]